MFNEQKFLAIETSSDVCSVALSDGESILERFCDTPREQGSTLLPFIDELLREANFSLTQLDAIAVSSGPGSFVGLRLAAGVAQGLAFAADLPIIPISSLAVLAQGVFRLQGHTQVLIVVNAFMKEVYWSAQELDQQNKIMNAVLPDQLSLPNKIINPFKDCVGVGSGFSVYQTELIELGVMPKKVYEHNKPYASDVISLAKASSVRIAAQTFSPTYLRTQSAWHAQ